MKPKNKNSNILQFVKNIFLQFLTFIKILNINLKIYKINKKKDKVLRELGLFVYEFYSVDKSLIENDEIKALVIEIKDFEIEIDELERKIEVIRDSDKKSSIDDNVILGTDETPKAQSSNQESESKSKNAPNN